VRRAGRGWCGALCHRTTWYGSACVEDRRKYAHPSEARQIAQPIRIPGLLGRICGELRRNRARQQTSIGLLKRGRLSMQRTARCSKTHHGTLMSSRSSQRTRRSVSVAQRCYACVIIRMVDMRHENRTSTILCVQRLKTWEIVLQWMTETMRY